LQRADKTVVEAGGVTPYLPLPEVRRRQGPATAAPEPPVRSPTNNGGASR
jgi:membrane protease subunit HflK